MGVHILLADSQSSALQHRVTLIPRGNVILSEIWKHVYLFAGWLWYMQPSCSTRFA
jgi:hypothetical protein